MAGLVMEVVTMHNIQIMHNIQMLTLGKRFQNDQGKIFEVTSYFGDEKKLNIELSKVTFEVNNIIKE